MSTPSASASTNETTAAQGFIQRWQAVKGSELASSQTFIIELCALLGVPHPLPTAEQNYMFERPITFSHGDGSTSSGRVDCYRRGCFVWESKKLQMPASGMGKAQKDTMKRAHAQAESYARALPASEGRPPFVVVADVGNVIELYSEFTRSGATYTPFPDPRSHRILLADLARPDVRERLRLLWLDPLALDPSRASAKVTRAIADTLAGLATSLEKAGHGAQSVAAFLTRCLFSMFAEDVGLLPKVGRPGEEQGSFVYLLNSYRQDPDKLAKVLRVFWQTMDTGGFNATIAEDIHYFNGKLFKRHDEAGYVLPLSTAQIDMLLLAAKANWCEVEPAIFGTLLERALSPTERHALGAHYTPRAYVERLVLPTVVEPLRADWADAQTAALVLLAEAEELPEGKKREEKRAAAVAELRRFHHQLCTVRVLDPACGSGNFLYVTLEHLKRLEGEVLVRLEELGYQQSALGLEGEMVTVQQLRGIELNPRAAALAELVLWIGWLQWQVRISGPQSVAEPVVHDYGNIECRDAVLACDERVPALDENGRKLTRWDGVKKKIHPVTGEKVPDESAQVPQWRYVNPRAAQWPEVDFIVGNPPFIGNKRMRDALGDGYVQSLRTSWAAVPDTADFVMYWWQRAGEMAAAGGVRRFGFITTNSITQIFNRKVIESSGVRLAFAIPDHPWVDSADGAAVRVAMTVGLGSGEAGAEGVLMCVASEEESDDDTPHVFYTSRHGKIHANLAIGADVTAAVKLRANVGISFMGMIPLGAGFWIDEPTAIHLGRDRTPGLKSHIKPYRNGGDLAGRPRGVWALDFFGLSESELREKFPEAYQWLLDRVKPTREAKRGPTKDSIEYADYWWIFAKPRDNLRFAIGGLKRYIGTTETAKHRLFTFIEPDILPDQKIRVVACEDALTLGVLSSANHIQWTLRTGGTLEDRPVYNNSRCFEPFPFPSDDTGLTPELAQKIGQLAEQIDAHRKARQAAHDTVTLTGLYNVLEKLRTQPGEPLNAKEKQLHEQGLVSVLRALHDELDTAVLQAYGWADLGPVPWADPDARQAWTDALLERLVALNARRAAEEAAGHIRWLRPEFQDPARRQAATETPQPEQAPLPGLPDPSENSDTPTATPAERQPWPAELPQQIRVLANALGTSPAPLGVADLAERFKGKGPWKKSLPMLLSVLEGAGRAQRVGPDAWRAMGQ